MAIVTLTNVAKTYPNGHRAVRDVSINISDGEFLVLVGPSGCGKSTVLRMIAGLEEVTSGGIDIGGRIVNNVPAKDRNIAMVFQNYALYPHLSVYRNMAFALKLRGMPKAEIERRVREVARILAIEELLDRKPGQLSGGQRQRVAVGRAIVREPQVFLFDEPLSNLDAKMRVATRGELKALHQRLKTTTVYVTHDQEEAMTLGDRIAVMSQGLVQQCDTPLNVYRRPANRFVAAFVGMPPMNFLEGRLIADAGALWFEASAADAGGYPGRLGVAPEHEVALRPRAGQPVALGLRPQSLGLRAATNHDAGAGTWHVPIRVVEPLGDLMDVSCGLATQPLVARLPVAMDLLGGSFALLTPNMSEAHWFETGEFGRRLNESALEA